MQKKKHKIKKETKQQIKNHPKQSINKNFEQKHITGIG